MNKFKNIWIAEKPQVGWALPTLRRKRINLSSLYQLAFIEVTLKLGKQSKEYTVNRHLTRFNTKSENYV